jgi:uncharacterized protein (DUF1800 family)
MERRTALAIAANRFGLGAKPHDLAEIGGDPRGWLLSQLVGAPSVLVGAGLRSSAEILSATLELGAEAGRARRSRSRASAADSAEAPAPDPAVVRNVVEVVAGQRSIYAAEVEARTAAAVAADRPFVERLTHFWTNHFAVSVDKPAVLGLAGAFEREAIRPRVLGNFADLLIAAERHAAMLIYLDNHLSIGPGSRAARIADAARNGREIGLNENLAREILELHTLGVSGGYTQGDVRSLAEVLTGWSIGGTGRFARRRFGAAPTAVDDGSGDGNERPGEFVFRPALHEPGVKEVLGKRYADTGAAQGESVLRDLAANASTARHVATKLARHFVADEPPAAAVERIAGAFTDSGGDLVSVYRALVDVPEAWREPLAKYKTPSDYVISTFRGLDLPHHGGPGYAASLELLGQRAFAPGSPAGWPDRSTDWDGSSALLKRIEWADALAQRVGSRRAAADLASQLLGGVATAATVTALERASSPEQAVTLLLTAPEFLRR